MATDDVLSAAGYRDFASRQLSPIPRPTEMLLHLIVHAVYEHGFCNGPLVLTDIAYLLGKVEVDWDRFWATAERGGWSEGCNLLLGLAEYYHRQSHDPSTLVTSPPPGGAADGRSHDAAGPCCNADGSTSWHRLAPHRGFLAKLGMAVRRARPERHALAAFAGVPTASRRPWLHYPAWLASRLRLWSEPSRKEQQRADMRRARALKFWLGT